jgi:hypothetical protein
MGKLTLIIGLLYFLYYAGNTIYDLFLKKTHTVAGTDHSEEFSIGDSTEDENPQNVSIDEVENLKTPSSFSSKTFNSNEEQDIDTQADIEHWRRKFEQEQDMDNYDAGKNSSETIKEKPSGKIQENTKEKPKSPQDTGINWKTLLNKAETQVQMLSNIDGYKVYKTLAVG